MSEASSAGPVYEAIRDTLRADADLRTFLRATGDGLLSRVWEGKAPGRTVLLDAQGNPTPYIIVGDGGEDSIRLSGRSINDGRVRLHCWVPESRKLLARFAYGHVRRILDRQRIVVVGFATLSCRTALVDTVTVQAENATQAVVDVSVDTIPNP